MIYDLIKRKRGRHKYLQNLYNRPSCQTLLMVCEISKVLAHVPQNLVCNEKNIASVTL